MNRGEIQKAAGMLSLAALVGGIIYRDVGEGLWEFVRSDGLFSYIPFVPIISAGLILWRRGLINWGDSSPSHRGLWIVALAAAPHPFSKALGIHLASQQLLWLGVISLVVFIWCAFIGTFGFRSFRSLLFPMGFLLFAVPPPAWLLDPVISALQKGSVEVVDWIFKLLVIPFTREGDVFHLPSFTIEVARNCSGIRSTIVLVMMAAVSGYIFLRGVCTRMLLVVCVLPISVLKNGIRVVTISILAELLGEGFFRGWLHRSGGVVFFLLALVMMVPIICWMRKVEPSRITGHKSMEEV